MAERLAAASVAVKRTPPYVRTMPDIVRLYFAGHRLLGTFTRLLRMVHIGVWLGLLNPKRLHAISEWKYSGDRRYWTDSYNNSGLWDWERKVVEKEYLGCRTVLLAAAGGGREVLALRRRGLEVEAFESDPGLLRFANEFLEKEGMVGDVRLAPWDGCPEYAVEFDGVIVGWGAYSHIRGRARRIGFLRALRRSVVAGGPILVSFESRDETSRYFRGIAWTGNALAWILRRDRVEVGDSLVPNYVHYFTKAQLESEMDAAGFELVSFDRIQYGHAVGRAV
jgi:hypothetical protein